MPIKNYQELRTEPDLKKATFSSQCKTLVSSVTHMRGWRKTMQDAGIWEFNFDGKGTHLFAVFDGHGGGEIAVFAKRYLKDLLLRNQSYVKMQYEKALQQIFPKLDALMLTPKGSHEVFEIKEQLQIELSKEYNFDLQDNSDDEMLCLAGSTAIVCLMTTETLYIASVGDSRCIISANHQIINHSIQHRPDLPEQKRRIQAAGGRVKNHRVNGMLGMSRSLGDFQFKGKKNRPREEQMVICDPQIEKIKNENIEFILLGCDGVWEGHDDEWYFNLVHEQMKKKVHPSSIVEKIVDHVVAKDLQGDNGHDNMTAILILAKEKHRSD